MLGDDMRFGRFCGLVCAVLIMVAGVAIIFVGSQIAGQMLTNLITGVTLTVLGLILVLHMTGLCPFCKD